MASIESLGLGSGVLTSELVENIINAEKEGSELRLDRRQELVEAKITAYGEISSLTATLQSTASALASPSTVGATKATSSNESLVKVSSSSLAEPGTYNIDVLNTAKSHALVTKAFTGFNDVVGTGQLVISFGEINYNSDGSYANQATNPDVPNLTFNVDESNQTLSGIRDAINNADAGVTASIVNDGNGYRLLLNSTDTGKDLGMRIAALDSSGNYLTSGLAQLGFNEIQNSSDNLQQTSRGEDAQISLNGLTINRSSNRISEVIKGVTLELKNADIGNTVSVSVESDTDDLINNMQDFVDAYNGLKVFTDELTSYDADLQQGGLLLGDSTLRTMLSQVRSLISQPIVGLGNSQFRSLTELGVNTNRNNDYLLEFDPNTFAEAVRQERNSIVGLLAKAGKTEDSLITYVNDSINTQAGQYKIDITQMASQAVLTSGSLNSLDFSSPVSINSSNNAFSINVNGANANIELTQGDYNTGTQLAQEIALQINSAEALSRFGYSVSVAHNASSNNFSITSNKYGSDSQVFFTSVAASTANTLGFSTLTGGTYEAAELTTINAQAFAGKGASTAIGVTTVDDKLGIDFATSNASFSLSLDGGVATPVTLNQSASGVDLNGDGIEGNRLDTLQAIQSGLDNTLLAGQVNASFDDQGYLIFTTSAVGANKSLEITNVGSSSADQLLGLSASQGVQSNGKDPGVTVPAAMQFNIAVDGISSTSQVAVAAGNYSSGDDLATALQAALNTTLDSDSAFAGIERGGQTLVGDRSIASGIDFAANPAGFKVAINGVEKEIIIADNTAALAAIAPLSDPLLGDSNSNLAAIQAELDAQFGSNVVTASVATNDVGDSALQLSTVATGHQQYIEISHDGRGAKSSAFADISSGLDLSSDTAEFTLTMDGVDLAIAINGDSATSSTGGSDTQANLTMIQQALDVALVNSGQFNAGDIIATVNSNNQLQFETMAKQGVKTAATFGNNASLQISNVNTSAANNLGIAAETQNNGYRGFGLDTAAGRQYGYDLEAQVTYQYDAASDLGSFAIQIGGEGTSLSFSNISDSATSYLGLQTAAEYQPPTPQGKDVAGTINGITATGNGQFLRATDGNQKATPGFYLGNVAADFTTPVVLDSTNNSFAIEVNGVNANISLNQPATYVSGAALASALQAAINSASEFQAENINVKVEYTDDPSAFAHQKFGIISNTVGKESAVEITDIDNAAAEIFGFSRGIGDGEKGKDASGERNPATGIRLKVLGGAIGSRGDVNYISGFADRLNNLLTSFLDNQTGILTNKESALQSDLEDIASDREDLTTRIEAQETRLKAQFLYNDKIISTLNTTLDFVKQQFESMNNSKKD